MAGQSEQTGSERYLVIKAKGGLGNRMLAAVTGLAYADLAGRQPVIDWRDGIYAPRGVNAYPLLFDGPALPDPAGFDNVTDVVPARWSSRMHLETALLIDEDQPHRHRSPTVYRDYCVPLHRIDHAEQVAVFMSYLPKMPRLARHFRKDPRFQGQSFTEIMQRYLAQAFRPKSYITDAVDATFADISGPVLGVHVRYTDLKVPLDKIIRSVETRVTQTPATSIFLSTDSAEVQDRFQAHFDRVHVTPKYLSGNGQQLHLHDQKPGTEFYEKTSEAENALIDMWSLARCDQLIYSSQSTFAISAMLLGQMEKRHTHDVDRISVPVRSKRFLQNYL